MPFSAAYPGNSVGAVVDYVIDNANNDRFWNFHPYPQRSYVAELKIDL